MEMFIDEALDVLERFELTGYHPRLNQISDAIIAIVRLMAERLEKP